MSGGVAWRVRVAFESKRRTVAAMAVEMPVEAAMVMAGAAIAVVVVFVGQADQLAGVAMGVA